MSFLTNLFNGFKNNQNNPAGNDQKVEEDLETTATLIIQNLLSLDSQDYYLEKLQNLIKDAPPETQISDKIPSLLLKGIYSYASADHNFEEDLPRLLNENQKALQAFSFDPEKLYPSLFEQKIEEYSQKFSQILIQMEDFLPNGFNLELIQQYEDLKESLQQDFKHPPELFFTPQTPLSSTTPLVPQKKLPLDEIFSQFAVNHYLNAIPHHLQKLSPQELATDNFLNYYQYLTENTWLYAYPSDPLPAQKALKKLLQEYDQQLQQKVNSVQRDLELKQDRLYHGLEKIVENPRRYSRIDTPQKVLEATFEKFASHTFKYSLLLEEDDPETTINEIYRQFQEELSK